MTMMMMMMRDAAEEEDDNDDGDDGDAETSESLPSTVAKSRTDRSVCVIMLNSACEPS